MAEFRAKSLAILGRQPQLGLAELESLYGAAHVRPLKNAALLDLDTKDIQFKRLGGTLKLAQVLTVLPTTKWPEVLQFLTEQIPTHMQHQPAGKFTLGLSVYGLPLSLKDQTRGLMAIKRSIRATGKPVRIIPNKSPALNSAQVLHNKLTSRGAWELLLVRDGSRTILAQTIFVQDIEAYAARDQARPARDARIGMLPPKLAQIMINLATSQINQREAEGGKRKELEPLALQPSRFTLLDPFCGTGVVLQEALLMEFDTIGSDINPKMVDFSKKNLDWLCKKRSFKANYQILLRDATVAKWIGQIDAVVSEIYLGKPLSKLPPAEKLHKFAAQVNNLLKKFLHNLEPQIKPGTRICLAVPAWRAKNGFVNLPTLDNLSSLGYNQLDFKHVARQDLTYFRPDQIVARKLIVLEKR